MKPTLVILIVTSVCYFFSYPGVDNDLWGHLFFGREILNKSHIPLQNLYSYTAPEHSWINHEWLAEVIFYGFYALLGSPGLILLKSIIGGGIVWMLNLTMRKKVDSLLLRTVTLVLVMAVLSPGFNVRPQIFTYLLFTAFLFLFDRYQERGKTTLYWMAPITVLWVNLHGGFITGLGAMGLFLLGNVSTRGSNGRESSLTIKRTLIPVALSLLSLVLNPYGLELLEFLGKDLLLNRPITEWGPIPLWDLSFIEFKVAFFVVLLSMRRSSWARWDFWLTLLVALFAFRHQRHTPLFAIAAAPLLAEGLARITQWIHWTEREGRNIIWSLSSRGILAVGIFGIAVLQIVWVSKTHWRHRMQLVVPPLEYPTQAADFLHRNRIYGNVAVAFDWGEYLIWKLYPDVRVSIDGRYTTAYPMEVIEDSWEWMRGGKGWRQFLAKYPAEIALTDRDHPVTPLLRKDPEWVYIYSDPAAFVFVRNSPGQKHLLKRFKDGELLPPNSLSTYFPG